MPAEDNKAAVRRFYQEVINGRNLDALDELLTLDGVDHTFGSQNPEQAKQPEPRAGQAVLRHGPPGLPRPAR